MLRNWVLAFSEQGVAPELLIRVTAALGAFGGLLLLACMAVGGLPGQPARVALALYALIAAAVLAGLRHHAPLQRFGFANSVTLLRATTTAFLAGVAAGDATLIDGLRGTMVGLGVLCLLCDGIDGWAARRAGTASAFGARFDVEIDALFVLVITLLLLRTGQAAVWALAIGLARYMFVCAGWLFPPLACELPESNRRKTICGATIVVLLVALAPIVGRGAARGLCAVAFGMVVFSFGVDCLWLLRFSRVSRSRAPRHPPAVDMA